MQRQGSIRTKLILNFTLVIIAVVTGVFGYHIRKTATELTRISAERQKFFVSSKAADALDLLITEDVNILKALGQEIKQNSPDVLYVIFRDAGGATVANTFEGGQVPKVMNAVGRGEGVLSETVPVEGFGSVLNITCPIQTYGKITVGFREATLVDVLKGEVLGLVGVYLVSVTLAALIAFWVAGRIVTPLNTLTKGIEAVGSGEIVSIPVTSSDELGQIASVFNSTMGRLKDYIQTDEERRRTQENVVRFLSVVSEAARGDLTKQAPVTPDTFGKIADAYNAMVQSLSNLMSGVRASANEVGSESTRLLEIFQTVTAGAEQQMRQIRDAAQSARETSGAAADVSSKAHMAQKASDRMDSAAEKGSELVAQNIKSMESINEQIQEISQKMKVFSDHIYSIENISQIIAEVTERTNILAMTAGIEAASAGAQGTGFLVIADEIKRLAERTASSTKQIDDVVKGIQREASEITGDLTGQASSIQAQARLARETGAAFAEIEKSINESKAVVGDISKLAERQSSLSDGVVASMGKVSDISQQTMDLVTNSASISEALASMSRNLLNSVSRFKLAARRTSTAEASAPAGQGGKKAKTAA